MTLKSHRHKIWSAACKSRRSGAQTDLNPQPTRKRTAFQFRGHLLFLFSFPYFALRFSLLNPNPPMPNPRSTVDLGCESFIRVENATKTILLPIPKRSFSSITVRPQNCSGQIQAFSNIKRYPSSPLIWVEKCILTRLSSGRPHHAYPRSRPIILDLKYNVFYGV